MSWHLSTQRLGVLHMHPPLEGTTKFGSCCGLEGNMDMSEGRGRQRLETNNERLGWTKWEGDEDGIGQLVKEGLEAGPINLDLIQLNFLSELWEPIKHIHVAYKKCPLSVKDG